MKATDANPYPRTFEEFLEWFPTDADCATYLEWVRWPGGFTCPECGSTKSWRTAKGLLHCHGCNRQISATAGTVFEDSRKPLRLWFHVMWMMMAQKTGLSARNLCDTYGFGSYQTAWAWLQKLRSVMIRTGRDALTGRVEVDEAFIGGEREGTRGRGAEGKTLVLVAVEGHAQKMLGRVRFRCVASIDRKTVESFVRDYVAPGTIVITTGSRSMTNSGRLGSTISPMSPALEARSRRNSSTMFIWSSPYSNAGWAPPTKVPSRHRICRLISMSSLSVSTEDFPCTAVSCSTGLCSKPSQHDRQRLRPFTLRNHNRW